MAIFDFDGVITDSVTLKAGAFVELFANASEQDKTKIIDYHLANGGVSREKKIRHFCENIFNLHLSSDQIKKLSEFHVMYFENVVRMKPWLLAIIFDSPKPSNEFNQDFLLMSMASDLAKDVTGIESSQEHFFLY